MIGIVISTEESPSTSVVEFVLIEDTPIHQGQYVSINHPDGQLIALVTDVKRNNRYFEHTEAVKEYSTNLETSLPVDEWSYTVVKTKPLIIWDGYQRKRPTFPPPPGSHVDIPSPSLLSKVLGFSEDGVFLGRVQHHNVEARFDLSKLLQKHLAILAMSGAGKSYLTSVLIEELLERKPEHGRIGIVVFDVHGEYVGFAYPNSPYKDVTEVFNGEEVKLSLKHLGTGGLRDLNPSISDAQLRELNNLDLSGDIEDLINQVNKRVENKKVRDTLVSNLRNVQPLGISSIESPSMEAAVKPGKLLIFDLSPVTDMRKKRAIVYYYIRRLFELRKQKKIPPTLIILEEAHQFAPEREEGVFSKYIIDTVAREGRKFGLSLCLISQRPIRLSTTALSQCNTHIILRITNPNDLDHIKESSEALDRQSVSLITTLTPGEALVVGTAAYFPVFIKVRERKSPEVYEKNLKDMALEWEGIETEEKHIAKQL